MSEISDDEQRQESCKKQYQMLFQMFRSVAPSVTQAVRGYAVRLNHSNG